MKVPCQKALIPNSPSELRITSIRQAPMIAPNAVPPPPARLAPPITAAAMTCSSIPAPMLVVTAPSQPVCTIPAIPADRAEIM